MYKLTTLKPSRLLDNVDLAFRVSKLRFLRDEPNRVSKKSLELFQMLCLEYAS